MPTVKNVGEPCAGKPHARIEVAAGGNWHQSALPRGAGASRRPYIELKSRRVHLAGCTTNPTGAWVTQQSRNLSFTGIFERIRFLIHDRDSKFSGAFDEIFHSEGIKVIHADPHTASERIRRTVRPHRPRRMSRLPMIIGRRRRCDKICEEQRREHPIPLRHESAGLHRRRSRKTGD